MCARFHPSAELLLPEGVHLRGLECRMHLTNGPGERPGIRGIGLFRG